MHKHMHTLERTDSILIADIMNDPWLSLCLYYFPIDTIYCIHAYNWLSWLEHATVHCDPAPRSTLQKMEAVSLHPPRSQAVKDTAYHPAQIDDITVPTDSLWNDWPDNWSEGRLLLLYEAIDQRPSKTIADDWQPGCTAQCLSRPYYQCTVPILPCIKDARNIHSQSMPQLLQSEKNCVCFEPITANAVRPNCQVLPWNGMLYHTTVALSSQNWFWVKLAVWADWVHVINKDTSLQIGSMT